MATAAAAAAASPPTDMPAAVADLPHPPPLPLPGTTRRPRRRTREVSSRYLSTPVPSSPRLSTSSSRTPSPTPSPRGQHRRADTPFANENHPPPAPAVPPSTVSRRRAVQKLFDEIGGSANPRSSVSAAATPRPLPRSTSRPDPSTARRGYPRLLTPARAISCPSAAASAADNAASCCSSDTASTFTDFSEADGIAVSAAPCESPPLLGPASCRGGRLSSELRSSVPESAVSGRASNPLCHRSLNSALSSCPAPAGKAVNAARPPQPHGAKAAELKKRRRAVQKLFDEIGGSANPRSSVSAAATPRPLPRSTSRPDPSTARRGYPRLLTPARAISCPSAAASAADNAASCCSSDTASTFTDFSEADGIAVSAAPCESPPLLGPASCRGGRLSSELRSSVPESAVSGRASNPLCHRSLNSALSSCPAPAGKAVNAARPPQPHGAKAAELKKATIIGGRKVAGKQEDVHQLRMLDNCYIQYRFLNARAAAAGWAKTSAAEKSLFGLAERTAGLRESVAEKKVEMEMVKREHRLCSVVDTQVPYLDQWCAIEGDYSTCLTGVTSALYNASLRLPVIGNVRANSEEIAEVLNSTVQLLEPLSHCVNNFLPKVQEVDDVASSLAQVIATERAMIEECGNLLYQAHNMQMREYSLRSQLMHLKQIEAT